MKLIDEQYLKTPFYGSRKMVISLNRIGHYVNRKRVQRLMRLMDIEAIYPKPNLSKRRQEHKTQVERLYFHKSLQKPINKGYNG